MMSGLGMLAGDGGDWRAVIAAALAALLVWALVLNAPGRGEALRRRLQNSPYRWPVSVYLLLLNGWLLSATLRLLLSWWDEAPAAWLLLLLLTLVYGYAAYRGEAALQRMAVLIVAIFFFWAIVDTLLLLPRYDLTLIAGMNRDPGWLRLAGAEALWLLAPLPALLVYLPGGEEARPRSRAARIGAALAALYLIVMRFRDQAVLGMLISLNPYPLLRTLSTVSAGVGLNRVEYFGLLALFGALLTGGMLILGAIFVLYDLERQKRRFASAVLWTAGQFAASLAFYFVRI